MGPSRALINVSADPDVPGWRQAAAICRRSPGVGAELGDDLQRMMTWEPRQRNSIRVVMSDALTSWLQDATARNNKLRRWGR